MIVYRLATKKYADDLSGAGAEISGGRWNFKGTRVLYTSDSRALCMAEIAVHTPYGIIPKDYYLVIVEIPEIPDVISVHIESLPNNWRAFPYSKKTQEVGSEFIHTKKHLYIKVPSAVVQGDYNILINPSHPAFERVKIISKEKFNFDERLFR